MSNEYKSVYVGDSSGRAKGYSQEELLARKLNTWQGWYCAASVENMFVTADGIIYGATCRQGGMLGNVNDIDFQLPDNWIKCEKSFCACGTDMMLRKSKTNESRDWTYKKPKKEITEDPTQEWVAPYHVDFHNQYPKIVTWDLGRRCNFSCTYCNPSISNNYEAHKTWGSLKHSVDSIFRNFCKGVKTKFVFTGGEPCINPAFMDLVKYIREQGHNLHVQTNGSRNGAYYSELIELSSVGFSVHLDFTKDDRLLETCQAVLNKQKKHRESGLNWFGIRIMVPPGYFDRALKLYSQIQDLDHFEKFGHLHLSAIYEANDPTKLQEYDPDELSKIVTLA